MVDNNPTIAFNLLLYLIQLSSDLEGGDSADINQKSNGAKSTSAKGSTKNSTFTSPEPSMVDGYLDTMTRSKRLTLHSLEVVNRLTGATTLSPRFLHGYIENAIRCCEQVEDKIGQARVVRMVSPTLLYSVPFATIFDFSVLRNDVEHYFADATKFIDFCTIFSSAYFCNLFCGAGRLLFQAITLLCKASASSSRESRKSLTYSRHWLSTSERLMRNLLFKVKGLQHHHHPRRHH